jgi:uncharacterized protein YjbJ (UPF0337 family)
VNEDRLTGTAKNLGGQLEEGYGRATGDLRSQAEGRARQAEGAIQDLYGQAKDAAGSAAQSVREHAREAEDFVCTMIEERPYTTAAVALGIGFLIGRFGRRDND